MKPYEAPLARSGAGLLGGGSDTTIRSLAQLCQPRVGSHTNLPSQLTIRVASFLLIADHDLRSTAP